jgi:hypothetical protein
MTEKETYMCKNLLINDAPLGNCTLTINKNYIVSQTESGENNLILDSTDWFIITTRNLFGVIGLTQNDNIECEEIDTGKKFSGRGFSFGFTINGTSDLIIT